MNLEIVEANRTEVKVTMKSVVLVRDEVKVQIHEDGRCSCSCAMPCPLHKAGIAYRCTYQELVDAGFTEEKLKLLTVNDLLNMATEFHVRDSDRVVVVRLHGTDEFVIKAVKDGVSRYYHPTEKTWQLASFKDCIDSFKRFSTKDLREAITLARGSPLCT